MSNIIYKDLLKYKYIYKITNLINNKIYIGQRQSKVESTLDIKYMGSGKALKRAFKKYGIKNFTKEIIEICESKEQLDEREIYWIKKFKSTDNKIGYNIAHGAGGNGAANKGNHNIGGWNKGLNKNNSEGIRRNAESVSRMYKLKTPDDKIIIIKNLYQFCKDNILNNSIIMQTKYKGPTKTGKNKGWLLIEKIND